MAWFKFLKTEGFFNPENNPEPIRKNDRWEVPLWEILVYLEKLSLQIKQGKKIELVDELLDIIMNVSAAPKDNYRTWYIFIKILSNIPNKKIPKEILHFIPVWLSGKFDTTVQSSELCDKLLPKFLNEAPTSEDIEKAEIMLFHLFQVEKIKSTNDDVWKDDGSGYRSKVDLYFLADKFEKRNITTSVVQHCSSSFILELGRTIKFLLLDYPNGINSFVRDNDKEYEVKIQINNEDLQVFSKAKNSESYSEPTTLPNWEKKSNKGLRNELITILKQQGINYTPTEENDDTARRLNFALNTDISSAFGFKSIKKLDEHHSRRDTVLDVFALIFRNLLDEKAKQNPTECLTILNTICFNWKFQLPFFKRITLFVIGENWDATKTMFWELVQDNDPLHLFSLHKYRKELYDLLNNAQHSLNKEEIKITKTILEKGQQAEIEEHLEKQKEYWQLGWYSALKDAESFKGNYRLLSKELNITNEHYESQDEIKVMNGSISPISSNELLNKSNQEIVEYIKSFSPQRSFGKPSISGLADVFGSAIEAEPEKFSSELELYQDIPYLYSYHLFRAFGDTWKKQQTIDWKKILPFCLSTLKSPAFENNELVLKGDDWNGNKDLVSGAISNLLTDGLQNNEHSIDIDLLPIVKEIITILITNLKRVDDFKSKNIDYPTYSLNSIAGKSLRALFDYSLHRARNLFKNEDSNKWEKDIKTLFIESMKKGIVDAFIIEGMYFQQFFFLDKEWITEEVKRHYKSDDREWNAFMGGIIFSKPPFNKELYSVFYPHYERLIDNNIQFNDFSNNGLKHHLTAFYFWRYESLSSEGLIYMFINKASVQEVGELIRYISQQKKYYQSLSELEKQEFHELIIELWTYLTNKYENSTNEEEQNNLAALSNWIVFVVELNNNYTNLILKSCKYIHQDYSTHRLLESLSVLKTKGNPIIAAKSIAEILSSLNFNVYMRDSDQEILKELVSFLFTNGQKKNATDLCNTMAAVHNQFFLRDIYEANANQ